MKFQPALKNTFVCSIGAWPDWEDKTYLYRSSARRFGLKPNVLDAGHPWHNFVYNKCIRLLNKLRDEVDRNRYKFVLFTDSRDVVFTDTMEVISRHYMDLAESGKVVFGVDFPNYSYPYLDREFIDTIAKNYDLNGIVNAGTYMGAFGDVIAFLEAVINLHEKFLHAPDDLPECLKKAYRDAESHWAFDDQFLAQSLQAVDNSLIVADKTKHLFALWFEGWPDVRNRSEQIINFSTEIGMAPILHSPPRFRWELGKCHQWAENNGLVFRQNPVKLRTSRCPLVKSGTKQHFLTSFSLVRDQEHYIREWLSFLDLVGVEQMVLVLHKCKDRTEEIIRSLPFYEKKIRLHSVTNDEDRPQMSAIKWMIEQYGASTEWMMGIDSDEFPFGTVEDDLRVILDEYGEYSGLAINWLPFGANNYVYRPSYPSIKHFTTRLAETDEVCRGVKSIVKPNDIVDLVSPHLFLTKKDTVLSNHRPVDISGIWHCGGNDPVWDVVRINHYQTRAMIDWVERYGHASCNDPRPQWAFNVDYFNKFNTNTVEDLAIQRFVPSLEKLIRR